MKFRLPRKSKTVKYTAPLQAQNSRYLPATESICPRAPDETAERDFKERMFCQTIRKARRSSLMEESTISLLSQNTVMNFTGKQKPATN